MRIIAYTYEADVHCVHCTQMRDRGNNFFHRQYRDGAQQDEHGIMDDVKDREGNPIHPIFSSDETPEGGLHCGECHATIREAA